MTNEELITAIQNGDPEHTAAAALYSQNRGLIYKICEKYQPYAEIDDLMQEAYFALMDAAYHFEEGHGTKFTTYATEAIRRRCLRYIESAGRTVRIPANMLHQIAEYEKLRRMFQENRHREPNCEEVIFYLHLSRKQYAVLLEAVTSSKVLSLDEPIKNDVNENIRLSDTLPDSTNIEEDFIDRECQKELWQHVAALPDPQREIIKKHHKDQQSFESIARSAGGTANRMRQEEQKGLQVLRRNKHVRDIAEQYGYGVQQAYRWSVRRFKDTWTSSTEWLALKRVEG